MVINIPIQVDEKQLEEVVKRDYEGRIFNELVKRIETVLVNEAGYSPYAYTSKDKARNGLKEMIGEHIDIFLKDNKDEIIDAASDKLASKLARSKKGREILEGKHEESALYFIKKGDQE